MSETEPSKGAPGRQSAGFATALRDFLGCGLIVVDAQRKVATITREAVRILGLDSPPLPGSSLEALPAALRQVVQETLTSGRVVSGLQIDVSSRESDKTAIAVSAAPLQQDRSGAGVVLVVHPLNAPSRFEQTLWRIDRLANIGTLAAAMAHEIKNALVAGKTFIDLLLEKHQDAELVDVVRREMGRIDAIVSRMLKFAGPDRPSSNRVSLHEILEHSLRLVQPQREDKEISLSESFQANPDLLRGDDYQLQQAFVNLFLNALEAMGPHGRLTVATASPSPAHIQVAVSDDGAGIAPENLERVFEPFFTTKPNGTGLGLPITRRIIEEHHGAIIVQSRPTAGTTFNITLPTFNSSAA